MLHGGGAIEKNRGITSGSSRADEGPVSPFGSLRAEKSAGEKQKHITDSIRSRCGTPRQYSQDQVKAEPPRKRCDARRSGPICVEGPSRRSMVGILGHPSWPIWVLRFCINTLLRFVRHLHRSPQLQVLYFYLAFTLRKLILFLYQRVLPCSSGAHHFDLPRTCKFRVFNRFQPLIDSASFLSQLDVDQPRVFL